MIQNGKYGARSRKNEVRARGTHVNGQLQLSGRYRAEHYHISVYDGLKINSQPEKIICLQCHFVHEDGLYRRL